MSTSDSVAPTSIFLIAGEPSGDRIGARLMVALRRALGEQVQFSGIGGEAMAEQGLKSQFPMSELSIMGFVEVVPRIPHLLGRIAQTVEAVQRQKPDALITIDTPAFSFRVTARLRGAGIPLIHYVAPQVWAYRPERAAKIAQILDHMMVLLPFEAQYFSNVGLPCSFVGHPVVEDVARVGDGEAFRKSHGIDSKAPLICALPGSRSTEVSRLLPVFGATMGRLAERFSGLRVVVPTVSSLVESVSAGVANWPVPPLVLTRRDAKYDAFAAANAALAASGTVALELALNRVPMVITYKTNMLTAIAARRMLRVPHVSLVNLILNRRVVPELLQQDCQPRALVECLTELIADRKVRGRQLKATKEIAARLGMGGARPSDCAADVVLSLIDARAA